MTPNPVPTLIVAKPGRMRTGLQALLRTMPEIEVAGQVDRASDALGWVVEQGPSLVLLDTSLPIEDRWMALKAIKTQSPRSRCILCVESVQEQAMVRASGADGVLLTGFAAETLSTTIIEVLAGAGRLDEQ